MGHDGAPPLPPPETPSGPAPMSLDLTVTLGGGGEVQGGQLLPQSCHNSVLQRRLPLLFRVQNDLDSHLV